MKEYRKHFPWEDEDLVFRTDATDFARVEGDTIYNGSHLHNVLKKIERYHKGEWEPYPSVMWIDGIGVAGSLELCTVSFEADEKGGINVVASPDGVPDGKLMTNAKNVGIITLYIDS